MADKTSTILLQYQTSGTDKAFRDNQAIIDGLKATSQATVAEQLVAQKLQQQLESLDRTKALKQLAQDAAAGITPLDQVLSKLDQMNASDSELQKLATDMDKLAQATANAGDQAGAASQKFSDLGNGADLAKFDRLNAGSGGSGVSAQQIGSRIAGLGSVIGGSGSEGFRDVSQLVMLGTSLGAVGVAAGVAAIAVKGYNDTLTASTERAKAFGDALEKAFSGTSADIQGYIKDTQAKIAADTAVRDSLQKLADAAPPQLATNLDNASESIANWLNTTAGGDAMYKIDNASISQEAYNSQVDEYNKKIQLAQIALDAYNAAVGNGIVASNSAAEAERQLADVRTKDADQEANTRTQLAALRRTGSVDSVNAELAANKERETILRNFLIPGVKDLGLTADEAQKRTDTLSKELTNLGEKDQLLLQAVLPVVAARETEQKLLQARKDQSDALNAVTQDLNKAEVALGDARTKTGEALAAVQASEAEHGQNLLDIQTTYQTAQTDALTKYNDKVKELDDQAAARRLEAHQRDDLSIRQAEASGNFARVQEILASQRLEDQQRKTETQHQKDDADTVRQQQLDAAQKQNTKLLEQETQRYSKEQQQRQQAYNKALQDERAQVAMVQSLRDQQTAITRYWISTVVGLEYQLQGATGAFADKMIAYANQLNSYTPTSRSVDSSGFTGWGMLNGTSGGSTAAATPFSLGQSLGSALSSIASSVGKGVRETLGGSGTPFNNVGTAYDPRMGGGASFRAAGGDVRAGMGYFVGERGMEFFQPKTDGYIVPNDKLGSISAGGRSNNSTMKITVRSEGDSAANKAAAKEIATQVVNQAFKQHALLIEQDE